MVKVHGPPLCYDVSVVIGRRTPQCEARGLLQDALAVFDYGFGYTACHAEGIHRIATRDDDLAFFLFYRNGDYGRRCFGLYDLYGHLKLFKAVAVTTLAPWSILCFLDLDVKMAGIFGGFRERVGDGQIFCLVRNEL